MTHNILIIEDNHTLATWLQDRLEFGLTDVETRVAYTDEDAFDQFSETKFALVFVDYELKGSRNGLKIMTSLVRNASRYHRPRAAWVHANNSLGASLIMAKLEDLLVPSCRHSLDWCKNNPTQFIETVEDILGGIPKETTEQPVFLLH